MLSVKTREAGEWAGRWWQERRLCERVEVRDPESWNKRERGDRGGVEAREETEAVPGAQLGWLTGREKEREKGWCTRSEHINVWVASLIRRCCQGPQRGYCRDTTSTLSSLSLVAPEILAGKMIDEWYQDKHVPWPQRQPCKMMHAAL